MTLHRAALLIFVFLLAMPAYAERLPAPKIFGIKLSEYQYVHGTADEPSWCIGIAWKRVPGAKNGINPDRPNKIPPNSLNGYAIRLWTTGNNAPAFVDYTYTYEGSKVTDYLAPSTSKWSNIRDTDWVAGNIGRKNLTLTVCGYAPHQEIHLRVRAMDKNRKYGKVSKKFTVNLPELGAYGGPQFFDDTEDPSAGRVVYGKWISW